MEKENIIASQFVPYELAVKLKELGFSESTFAYYENNGEMFTGLGVYHSKYIVKGTNACVAPLWQQAFDWFRNYHNAVCSFNWHTKGSLIDGEFVFKEERTTRKELINWSYEIDYFGSKFERPLSDALEWGFETYEQARLACLEKLIELVTNK